MRCNCRFSSVICRKDLLYWTTLLPLDDAIMQIFVFAKMQMCEWDHFGARPAAVERGVVSVVWRRRRPLIQRRHGNFRLLPVSGNGTSATLPEQLLTWHLNDTKMTKKWHQNDIKIKSRWHQNDAKMTTKRHQNDTKIISKLNQDDTRWH